MYWIPGVNHGLEAVRKSTGLIGGKPNGSEMGVGTNASSTAPDYRWTRSSWPWRKHFLRANTRFFGGCSASDYLHAKNWFSWCAWTFLRCRTCHKINNFGMVKAHVLWVLKIGLIFRSFSAEPFYPEFLIPMWQFRRHWSGIFGARMKTCTIVLAIVSCGKWC